MCTCKILKCKFCKCHTDKFAYKIANGIMVQFQVCEDCIANPEISARLQASADRITKDASFE